MSAIQFDKSVPAENLLNEDDVNDIDEEIPFELLEMARQAVVESLTEKSRDKYICTYNIFKEWQKQHGMPSISNNLILAYFHMMAKKKYKPSSLWAYHSMLKATIRTFEDVDIGNFKQVTAFLKSKGIGYKSKKARVFTEDEIKHFIDDADDLSWLDLKTVCIFGLCGAMRTDEFTRITMEDVEKHGNLFLVKIHQTKTHMPRSFTINGSFAGIVQKFLNFRPVGLQPTDRLFCNYQRGKCYKQFIGKSKFSRMPRRIAEHLSLLEPERYTGHSFRRTSATFLANSGADIETIMRHGGWRNESCAKIYIEDSLAYKARTGDMIQQAIVGTVAPSVGGFSEPQRVASIARTVAPTVELTNREIVLPASVPFNASDFTGNEFFDSAISNEELSEIVDSASQSYILIVAPTVARTGESLPAPDIFDVEFDSAISNNVLMEIVDRESQSYQSPTVGRTIASAVSRTTIARINAPTVQQAKRPKLAPNVPQLKASNVMNDGLYDSAISNEQRGGIGTQSTSNSMLNEIMPRTFKSVTFGRMENCHFNFYFTK